MIRAASAILVPLMSLTAIPLAAQIRPLEPLAPGTFDEEAPSISIRGGMGLFTKQRASLAGTIGTLREIGNFTLVWRTGRVALEAGGTVLRVFDDDSTYSAPIEGVDAGSGPHRTDSGDYRVATAIRLTPDGWPATALLRFGTRLPTTDNTIGIDRDRTDFFALAGVQSSPGRWRLAGEAGLGVHGTHDPELEQSDVLVYSAIVEYRAPRVAPVISLVGHADGIRNGSIRGSEELAELRVGARLGRRANLRIEWVRGLVRQSPRSGYLISAGWSP
jgi:hypothetical protein